LIEDWRSDPVFSFLLSRSSLTETQLDTLLLSQLDEKLAVKAAQRGKRVSKGAFLRTLRQCQFNVEASLYTLFLIGYVGLLPQGKYNQLARTGELLSRLKETQPSGEELSALKAAMQDFVEQFSGKTAKRH
jgi:hypothetical protein